MTKECLLRKVDIAGKGRQEVDCQGSLKLYEAARCSAVLFPEIKCYTDL